MSGLALKVSGYTAPPELNLPKLYKDAVIDSGSIFAYDSSFDQSWSSQSDAVVGSQLLNLVNSGGAAIFNKSQLFQVGSGFNFTASTDQYITLPSQSQLTGYDGCFAVGVWLKSRAQTQVNTSVFGWYNRGIPNGSGVATALGGWGMRHASGGTHYLICGDKTIAIADYTTLRQVVIARVKDSGGNYFAAFYRNGIRIALQAMSATMLQPATPPTNGAVLGDVLGIGDTQYWEGHIGRSWFTRKDFTVEEMDVKVLKDYNMNSGFYI